MKKIEFPILEADVAAMLPQKTPFVLVSKIIDITNKKCTTEFDIPISHVLVFDGRLSEAGLIENMAQSCAAMMGAMGAASGEEPKVGFIGDVRNFFSHVLPLSQETIKTEVEIENQIFDVTMIDSKVYYKNELIAGCKMKIFVKPN